MTDADILLLLVLFIVYFIGLGSFSGGGGVLIPGYSMKDGYEYICSDCGFLVPKNYYHGYRECQMREGKPKHPDHRVYYGAKPFIKAPDWHYTLEEQRI